MWLGSIVKTHVKMVHVAETLEEPEEPEEFEESRGMVVIDAYSVHRSPSFARLFQSAQTDAEPAHGTLPRTCLLYTSPSPRD